MDFTWIQEEMKILSEKFHDFKTKKRKRKIQLTVVLPIKFPVFSLAKDA